jgi:protease I
MHGCLGRNGRFKEAVMADLVLDGLKVAILATDGFEQSELFEPKQALEDAGAEVELVSIKNGELRAWKGGDWGDSIAVDREVYGADPAEYDALFLPGGVINPDRLRMDPDAIKFAKAFLEEGKPVAAICHGPQLLIETGILKGRTLTSWPSLKTDLVNAGANWVNEEVVTDNGLVTSRKPEDIPAFCRKMIEEFSEGKHETGTAISA